MPINKNSYYRFINIESMPPNAAEMPKGLLEILKKHEFQKVEIKESKKSA